jgi:hypothetical protein
MFCSQCGSENQPAARFCQKCGNALSSASANETASTQPQVAEAAIWNPNAAANWSLIFTPAFGAYLQMLNWRALGEPERAASSQNWFYVGLGMLAVYVLMGAFMNDPKAADGAARGLGFLFLLVWYFSSGRAQGKYVKEKLGKTYAKKPWGKALLIGVGAIVGYFIVAVVIGLVLGVAS